MYKFGMNTPWLIANNDNETEAERRAADAFLAALSDAFYNPQPDAFVFPHLWLAHDADAPQDRQDPFYFIDDSPHVLDFGALAP